jgi:hypothetical protein
MAEKNFNNVRIILKHDIEANWAKASFIPRAGEIVIYDIDDNHNVERMKIGDGVSVIGKLPFYSGSWNDLADKPFGEEATVVNEPLNITWDGNTDGLVSVGGMYWKISDAVLTDDQLKLCTLTMNDASVTEMGESWDFLAGMGHISATEDYTQISVVLACVRKAGVTIGDFTFPEVGCYASVFNEKYITSITTTEPIEQTKTVVKKIDEKYLNIIQDDDFLLWLNEANIVEPVRSASGEIYTTSNNEIYIL